MRCVHVAQKKQVLQNSILRNFPIPVCGPLSVNTARMSELATAIGIIRPKLQHAVEIRDPACTGLPHSALFRCGGNISSFL